MIAAGVTEGAVCKGEKLAPFNPSGHDVVELALALFRLQSCDILYDLGCGDARVLIGAAKECGVTGVGVEYDEAWVKRARSSVEESGLSEMVSIVHDNVLAVDLSPATAIFVYLVPKGIELLREQFVECLSRGVRIVSYVFSIPGLEPLEIKRHRGTKIYLYAAT